MHKKFIVMGSTLLLSAAMLAQDSSTATAPASTGTPAASTPEHKKPNIAERKRYQQRRIAQGVKSGELNKHETAKLEKQEHALNREERNMRKMDNGHLTKQDRKTLRQQQNHMSKEIYKDKHNKRKRAGAQ